MTHHAKEHGGYSYVAGIFRDGDSADCCISELKWNKVAAEDIMLGQKGRERAVGESGVSRIEPKGGLEGLLNLLGLGTALVEKLEDLGFQRDQAQLYADHVDSGDILLATKCVGQREQIEQCFIRCGAVDVYSTSAYRSGDAESGREKDYGSYGSEFVTDAGSRAIPIREEPRTPHKEERRAGEEVPRVEQQGDVSYQDVRDEESPRRGAR